MRGRANRRRLALRLVMALLLWAATTGRAVAASACATIAAERATVAAISERLEISLVDGRVIRLAGLDTPDPGRGDPDTSRQARAFLAQWLVGRSVDLLPLAAKPDRWGRVAGDVLASPPSLAAPGISVSIVLLSAGYARVWPQLETRPCAGERLAAEAQARNDGLGLWSDPYYAVVKATDLDNLRDREGQFTLVEGTALRVGEGRSRYYIDLALHRGFTIVVPKRRSKAFERAGVTIPALAGARVRVRGALDARFGLRIEISEPEDLERLE